MGDDEVNAALQQIQLLVDDMDVAPPLKFCRESRELQTFDGKIARQSAPRDVGMVVLADDWVSLIVLESPEMTSWTVSATGFNESEDMAGWLQALGAFMGGVPVENFQVVHHNRGDPDIPGASGFKALSFVFGQIQGEWHWHPLQSNIYTGDPLLDMHIYSHLQSLEDDLIVAGVPTYYVAFVLRVRGLFLKSANHWVQRSEVRFGRRMT